MQFLICGCFNILQETATAQLEGACLFFSMSTKRERERKNIETSKLQANNMVFPVFRIEKGKAPSVQTTAKSCNLWIVKYLIQTETIW